jgi:hypothetical protein
MATKTTTETNSRQAETPFRTPTWAWNFVPAQGQPARSRCQAVVSLDEVKAGQQLIAKYREAEKIAADHDIGGKQGIIDANVIHRTHSAVELEEIRREITKADHGKYLEAQAKLGELRRAAYELASTIFRKLTETVDRELNEAAVEAEARLNKIGIPIQGPAHLDSAGKHTEGPWMLHNDSICQALWSQRFIAEKTFAGLTPDSAIGATQWFCSDESGVPFSWR